MSKNQDSLSLAMTLGREINRQIRKIEARRGATDDEDGGNPFAGVTRGKTEDARKLRNLVGARNDLGAAFRRFDAVAKAYEQACEELRAATELTCQVVGVEMRSLAESIANVGDAPKPNG